MHEPVLTGNATVIGAFGNFLVAKFREGIISVDEMADLSSQLLGILNSAGEVRDDDPVVKPIIKHAMHQVKVSLLKMHPELTSELSRLEQAYGRGR